MTRATSNRLDRIETIVTDRKKREQADRSRIAHTRAASASQAEIDAIIANAIQTDDPDYLKKIADHELLILLQHHDEYVRRIAKAIPQEQEAELIRRYEAAPDKEAFLEQLNDVDLTVLAGDADLKINYSEMTDADLDEIIHDASSERIAAIRAKYIKP